MSGSIDIVQKSKDNLIPFFNHKGWNDLLESILDYWNQLEDAGQEMLDNIQLSVAGGTVLDEFYGDMAFIGRTPGMTDARYRQYIQAANRAHASDSTEGDFYDVAQLIAVESPPNDVQLVTGDGYAYILIPGIPDSEIYIARDVLQRAAGTGRALTVGVYETEFWGLQETPGVANPPWGNPMPH